MAPEISSTHVHDIMQPKSELLYPATDIIYKLLKVVGAEVCSFHRNQQVAYRLVECARDLFDAINARIHLVDKSDSWEDYEIYTQAIDPLEEILLKFVLIAFDDGGLDHLATSSWAEYVRVTEQWRENRLEIRNCFRSMKTKPQFQALISTLMDGEDDILDAYILDDLSYLDYLLRIIEEGAQQIVEPKVKGYIEKVVEGLSKTRTLQHNNLGKHGSRFMEISALPIQCGFLASKIITMMVNVSIPEDIRNRLTSDSSFWGALANLVIDTYNFMVSQLINVEEFDQTEITITITKFTTRYTVLVNQVSEPLAIEMPLAYSRLLPLVGKISRRYHAQSLLLVAICRQATSQFTGPKKNMGSRDVLERALNQTVAALEAAAQGSGSGRSNPVNGVVTNGTEGIKKAQDSIDDCTGLYKQSVDELMACFQAMEIRCDTDYREALRQAQSRDSTRVSDAAERLNKYEHPSTMKVTVDVYDNNQQGNKVKSLLFASIPATARLSYVKHLAANQLEDRASAQAGHFERAGSSNDESSFLSLGSEVRGAVNGSNAIAFIAHPSGKR
ncbi:unnamed protein product [Rhizoctonia solani]|uniref:Uncharacterized protein n=1 Tax=Rhizoctonia solani TaxID=456999 RepID=A0A8H2ZVX1_9AGAM|nr:unnamed protein product [Rhizoctonia solani]